MVAHGRVVHARRASRTSCSATCASPPGASRTCTSRGSTRTRSGASRWSATKRMATFDDMALERKVTIYDKGFDPDFRNYGEYITRSGDVTSPQISNEEPLRIECRHFVDCVRTGAEPRSGAASGLRAVRVLEALQRSLDAGGAPQRLRGRRAASREALRPSLRPRAGPDARPRRRARRRTRARRVGRDPQRHRDRRRLRDPGRRRARQAAAAGRTLDRAARGARAACRSAPRRVDLRRRGRVRGRAASARGAIVGDQAQVRERATIGDGAGDRPRHAESTTTSRSAPACGSSRTATWPPAPWSRTTCSSDPGS